MKNQVHHWADLTGRRNTFNQEVFMGRPAGWMKQLTGRDALLKTYFEFFNQERIHQSVPRQTPDEVYFADSLRKAA